MKRNCHSLTAVAGLLLSILLPARAQVFTTQHTFANTPDGANPAKLSWMNGLFYGSTGNGGANGKGSLFKLDTNGGVFTTIYSFTDLSDNGNQPNNLLVTSNAIYGTALGGSNYLGMIFKVNTNGSSFRSLYSFAAAPDGNYPQAGLILSGATLYGTANNGGANSGGTIFKINTDGTGYMTLHGFTNTPDGFGPRSELVLSGGTIFGTTESGGSSGGGTVFGLNTNGSGYTILHSFTNNPDGYNPNGGLVVSSGILYGTTMKGGSGTNGTVFAMNTDGSGFRVLHNFTYSLVATNADGKTPKATLSFNNGYLYGTTISGGIGAGGTIFLLNTNGTAFNVLRHFTNNAATGSDLESGALRLGNSVWGTTYLGGSGFGVLYSMTMPAITLQPLSVTVPVGSLTAFTVTAADDSPISYQWYLNTTAQLAGQTNSTLAIASANSGNAGSYTVVVADSFGSVTSSPATLTLSGSATAPAITQQPQNFTVTNGFTASFTNVATGTAPLSYQWYLNTNTPVAGGTGAILVLSPATTNQAGFYTVVVSNIAGSATSSPARLTVIVPATPPAITQQPQNYTVTNGFTASFTNVATGTAPLSYQWYFNANTPVAGGTGAILVLSPATTNQAGFYTVVVTNIAGRATSSPASLTVIVPPQLPVITQQPQNYTVTNGFSASFTNVATSATPLSYQWYFNTNTPVAGGTNSILLIGFATTNQAGFYTVVVGNTAGSVTSSPALLTVISTKPIIIAQPQPLSVTLGDAASFAVTAAGLNPLRYQWYFNSVPTSPGTPLAGQTNSVFTFTSSTNSNGRYYTVVITNTLGMATSTPAQITVITAPLITTNPQPLTVTVGAPATFSVSALGVSLRYQWYSNTVSTSIGTLLAGQTNSVYSFTSTTNSNNRYYSVVLTNTYGRATSSPALLIVQTVAPAGQPKFLNFSFIPASGSFALTLSNTASSANRLWASTNLTATNFWRVVASNVMAANGLWLFTDTNVASTNNVRFYRASCP